MFSPKSDPSPPSNELFPADGESYWFLQGGGESGATARSTNWESTPLGPPDGWSSILKSTLATMFRAAQPMFLFWGDELIQFYNDAYLPSFGRGKHPGAMGQRGPECWEEIWDVIAPRIEDVMERAIASWNVDALVPIFRNNKIEEVYWTYSYCPVFDETGQVAGVLVICTETTPRVLGERRTLALYDFATAAANAQSPEDLLASTLECTREMAADVAFVALLHELPGEPGPRILLQEGISKESLQQIWLHLSAQSRTLTHFTLPTELVPSNGVSEVYRAYCVNEQIPCQFLFGVNPNLSFDASYERFFEQIVGQFENAKGRLVEGTHRASIELERERLLEQAPMATAVLVGPDLRFQSANARYEEMVGKTGLVGQSYLEAFPELAGSELLKRVQEVYTSGEGFTANEWLVQIDRGRGVENCYFNFSLEPIRDSHSRVYGMMMVAVELTEQVESRRVLERAHNQREELLASLEDTSRAKDEFIAILGHELRNPLSPILTALHLMRQKGDTGTNHEQEVIERQVRHLMRLVDDLLDVSKIAQGKVELKKERVDLRDIALRAMEIAGDLLEQRRHHVELYAAGSELYCFGDPVRLCQIITNLLTNSARYTDPGGQIGVYLEAEGDELVLSVEDNGRGIAPETLPHVFNLFEQAKRSSDRAEGGLGIGLTLVQNLVTLHGGRVSAHSEGLGQGSRFVVRLPVSDGPEELPQDRSSPAAADPSPHPKRILLVDDNRDAAELLALALEAKGHLVRIAFDPLEGLAIAAEMRPDCAVLDLGLPVIDGYELAIRLKMLPGCEATRLIALSGYGSPKDRERGVRAGFDEHLVKPVDFKRLVRLVEGD